MQLNCPHCHAVLEYADRRPAFCAFCGHPLGGTPQTPATVEAAEGPQPPSPGDVTTGEETGMVTRRGAVNAESAAHVPDVIGGYRLLRPLGEGGMGTVYEAEEIAGQRRVALKLIAAEFAASPEAVERFRLEGKLASTLVHPRCVFVLAADEEAGRPYIVMELMPGKTLEDLVRERGPLPVEEAVPKILDVIDGLQEAHHFGVIHRDVKPSNCFLESDGRVKVGDFGLAKSLAANVRLTRTGSFLGTPLYASPEQVKSEPLTPQTDVYSAAATLYFLLAGKAPFECGNPAATLARIASEDPPALRTVRPDIPEALDRVVLRALERKRERRYKDLGEFRQALQPFLPGKSPFVSLSLRFGAYLIDYVLFALVRYVISFSLVINGFPGTQDTRPGLGQLLLQGVQILVYFLYFLPECFWGYSVGKGLLRLRVTGVATNEPPGLWRGLLRTGILYLLLFGGSLSAWILAATIVSFPIPTEMGNQLIVLAVIISGLQFGGPLLGLGFVCCTMRTRNGLRGLHDIATGTRVIRVPPSVRRGVRGHPVPLPLSQPPDLPERIGPFRIKGALEWTRTARTVLGEDLALGRAVVIKMRPLSAPPFDTARRDLTRTSRQRWLVGGRNEDRQWDAFLAPSGCSLPALVGAEGPLAWPDARRILEELTEELGRACEDHTLPASLRTDQIWIQPNGQVLFLDAPLVPANAGEDASAALTHPGDGPLREKQERRRCLALLGDVAALAVRGGPGTFPPEPAGPGAPLPLHAVQLLRRFGAGTEAFQDLTSVQEALEATQTRPVEISRAHRTGHLLVLAAFLFIGLCFIAFVAIFSATFPFQMEMYQMYFLHDTLGDLERGARRDFLMAALNPNPATRLLGAAQYANDMQVQETLREQEARARLRLSARLAALFPPLREAMRQNQTFTARYFEERDQTDPLRTNPLYAPADFRRTLTRVFRPADMEDYERKMANVCVLMLLLFPALWVLWAFPAREGLSFLVAGLALVRWDGRRAELWRCAWRALLVWGPVAALLAGSTWLSGWYWIGWEPADPFFWVRWLAQLAFWAGMVLLPVYVVLALRSPSRGFHDRLAGTVLVPK
jgi:hypothetical protein